MKHTSASNDRDSGATGVCWFDDLWLRAVENSGEGAIAELLQVVGHFTFSQRLVEFKVVGTKGEGNSPAGLVRAGDRFRGSPQ